MTKLVRECVLKCNRTWWNSEKPRQFLFGWLLRPVAANHFSCFASSSAKDAVVIKPSAKHTATVFFLHGLGDTGHGWASFMHQIRAPHIKYICPHAPMQAVTLNMGMVMPSWFDIKSLGFSAHDEQEIKSAAKNVHGWLEKEISSGIPNDRIVMGGFSQGGALALYSTFTYDKPLAGFIGLSTWLPLHKQFPAEGIKENLEIPMFQGHGSDDPMVPHMLGQSTANYIKAFNPHHTFKTYQGMPHSACDEEIEDMQKFLAQRLPKID